VRDDAYATRLIVVETFRVRLSKKVSSRSETGHAAHVADGAGSRQIRSGAPWIRKSRGVEHIIVEPIIVACERQSCSLAD
jgi:hypothetical protein